MGFTCLSLLSLFFLSSFSFLFRRKEKRKKQREKKSHK